MQLKPAPGRAVPDPEKGGFLPQEGRAVEATAYWLRRLADGDVVEFEVKPSKKQERQA
ncbi:MAG: DUF2635 domain-containing protein [Sulfuritalea sp.]|jgi:hypothetical protein|nr:DUF2635 domain-containing protein [Sulfuritalea sp.]